MKMKLFAISTVSAALLLSPSLRADDNDKNKDVNDKARTKISEAQRKTHEKICQGHHGAVTAKTDTSITVDGKAYALTLDTPVNKQEEPLLLKTVKVGDTVCFRTQKAADGSQQIAKLMAIGKDEQIRVREKDSDSPRKREVTPKDEVK